MSSTNSDDTPGSFSRDDVIVHGSTWAAIWHMSWPLLLQMSSVSLASFCDVWVAGKLGSEVQAAIGICGQIWFLMLMMTVALSAGTTALVSRYWGARDLSMAITAAKNSMQFAFIFGVSSAALGMLAAQPLLAALGASPRVAELGWHYLQIDLISQLPFTIVWVSHAIWRARGNARVPMLIWFLMTIIIVALDIFLCLGPPALGIRGIGAAWVIAAFIGASINIFLLSRTDLGACARLKDILTMGLDRIWMWRILKIGIPACISDMAWVGGCFVLFTIFARTSDATSCQAAWAIGFRLEEIVSCLPVYALSAAVATIVGQNLGAEKPERAEKAGWQVAMIGVSFTAIMAIILFVAAEPISRMFSEDEKVIAYSSSYFRIVGMSQPFVSLWLILFGAMQGAGYTTWPMWASIFGLTVVRLPLAWILTDRYFDDPTGCWIGLAASSTILGLIAVWRYWTGVWKQQRV